MAHALCMLDTKGYKHTLRICITYCFSTASIVARKRLSAMLYVTAWLVLLHLNIKFYPEIFSKLERVTTCFLCHCPFF